MERDSVTLRKALNSTIPYNATSFSEIDAEDELRKMQISYSIVLEEFITLGQNISWNEKIVDKIAAWRELGNSFADRIQTLASSPEHILDQALQKYSQQIMSNTTQQHIITEDVIYDVGHKILDKLSADEKLAYANQYYSLDKHFNDEGFNTGELVTFEENVGVITGLKSVDGSTVAVVQLLDTENTLLDKFVEKEITQLEKQPNEVNELGGFTLTKSLDGRTVWYGVFTNNYLDRHKDIISEEAHINYVKNVNSGLISYPPLFIWHIPKQVGTTEFMEYIDGFVAVGGYIDEEFVEIVENISETTKAKGEELGMSHKLKGLKDSTGTIVFYYSDEVTMLPLNEAANLLTTMGVK